MITWEDFNSTNANNKKTAFENMCRILFNYYFFNNTAILKQKYNNPGIEVEPVECKGKRISFQAKYIESGNVYDQIKDSVSKVVKYYKGSIDVVYLFSNKDLDSNSEQYESISKILKEENICLERICNQEILSIIESQGYNTIKQLFFGKHYFTKEWFDKNLRISLEDLEPRYITGFNVDTYTQNFFEIKYLSNEVFTILKGYLEEWKEKLRYINLKEPLIERIKTKISNLIIPLKEHFADIFNWYSSFSNEYNQLKKIIDSLNKHLSEEVDGEKRRALLKKRSDYYDVLYIIEQSDFSQNALISSFNSNVLFIEGDAGIGKSHLLGYEAEKHGNSYNRTILLLGQKFIGNNSPLIQFKEQLNTGLDIDAFFDVLEGLGEIDGSSTVIMLDALNESANHIIWKNYLNSLVSKILEFKHIKLIATIRSTYINQIFSNSIQTKIRNREIYKIRHNGFEGIIDTAITKFFNHYKIPIDTLSYLGYSFKNPLFLNIYCKSYENNHQLIGAKSLDEIFNNYINEEEVKIKEKLNIDGNYPYCKKIMENMAEFLYHNQTNYISIEQLFDINKSMPNYDKFIPQMQKSKLLISYIYDDIEYVYFGYERICDFYIAKHIVNKFSDYQKIKANIIASLLKVDKFNHLLRYNAIGVFSALSILISEKFHEEILSIIDSLSINTYQKNEIIKDYLENLSFREDSCLEKDKLLQELNKNLTTNNLVEVFYNTLLSLSGRTKNPLNALYLHSLLKQQALNQRDVHWTIFINGQFESGYQLFHIINYFENNLFIGDFQTKKLYSILLTWLLTSSNRKLRDRASRCIVNLFKDDYDLMIEILDLFYDVNDPYVIQRLYGIIYGAVLKSQIDKLKLTLLCTKIFHYVFNKDYVYPDVLLRDYCLNIIEYASYIKCSLSFDILKCRPPYCSKKIPLIDPSIEKYFSYNGGNFTGANSIKHSMLPNIDGGYGDFGRYVFESAVTSFDGVDLKNLYLFSLEYIKNELGYSDKLFSDYDRSYLMSYNYDRHNTTKIERIGKKYQWIAFYHILALLSDECKLSKNYNYFGYNRYKGTWNPYVRDFDPTLDLTSCNRVYDFNLTLNQPVYNSWGTGKNWVDKKQDVVNFKELIFVKDNYDADWILLYGQLHSKTGQTYEENYKDVWRMVAAYVIQEEKYNSFISKLKTKPLWGRWFPESCERYNIYSREYSWSPAYKDEYKNESFEIEIATGETRKKVIKVPKFDIDNGAAEDQFIKIKNIGEEEQIVEEHIKEKIGRVRPLWNSFLWEEQYDASKEETIKIHFPTKELISTLNLRQRENGAFYHKEELVVADFSLVKGTTNGLYIKRDFLDKFLHKKKYKIFWICVGEKNDVKKTGWSVDSGSVFNDFSSLVFIDNEKVKSVDFFESRAEH